MVWQSAWKAGDGQTHITDTTALQPDAAIAICRKPDFLPSLTIDQIGGILK